MLDKFWDKIGENLAGEWNIRVLTVAFAFWGGGLVFFGNYSGWDQVKKLFDDFGQNPILGGAFLVGGLVLTAASNVVIGWLTRPFLKLMEGYWPEKIREWAKSIELRSRSGLKDKYNALLDKKKQHPDQFLLQDERNLAKVEYMLRYRFPFYSEETILPTKIGNVRKSAEEYSYQMYGLETTITWPHMWLNLPDHARQELAAARQSLDEAVMLFLWGLLFCLWVYFAWWAPLLGLAVMIIAWFKAEVEAFSFGLLLRTAYDLYRFDLYKSLHWYMPSHSEMIYEKSEGLALTQHLYRHNINKYFDHPQ